MKARLRPCGPLTGKIDVPGDKSITHRALMLSSLAEGDSRLAGSLRGADCQATRRVLEALGVAIDDDGADRVVVRGSGLRGWRESATILDCARSGTTMRLMAGLLAGQSFYSVLSGDAQLLVRPMGRVTEPLGRMGARIWGRASGAYAPLRISGGDLQGVHYRPAVASAQVKSSVLLAGLYAAGETIVSEPGLSRDHTERMLRARGVKVESRDLRHRLVGPAKSLAPLDVQIPGDFSSAAYFVAAALLAPDSELLIRSVGVNPTRTGFLEAVRRMGADIELIDRRDEGGEPVADLLITSQSLRAIKVGEELVPTMIDELPLLALVATQAQGITQVRGAAELRVKETDRIAGTVTGLRALGAKIEGRPDGFAIEGPTPLEGAHVDSGGDHRIAMTLVTAGLIARGETMVDGVTCIADSFPGFAERLARLGVEGVWT